MHAADTGLVWIWAVKQYKTRNTFFSFLTAKTSVVPLSSVKEQETFLQAPQHTCGSDDTTYTWCCGGRGGEQRRMTEFGSTAWRKDGDRNGDLRSWNHLTVIINCERIRLQHAVLGKWQPDWSTVQYKNKLYTVQTFGKKEEEKIADLLAPSVTHWGYAHHQQKACVIPLPQSQ